MDSALVVGDFVKLGSLSGTPFPKLMRGSIQKVVAVRSVNSLTQVKIERLHKKRMVSCWIDTYLIEKVLSPEEAFPASACPVHAPHRKNSGEESLRRQRCLICKEKYRCHFYRKSTGGFE